MEDAVDGNLATPQGKSGETSGVPAYQGGMPLLTSITSRQLTRYQSQQESLNAGQRHHDAIALSPVRSRSRPAMDRGRSVLPVTDDAIEPVLSHDMMDTAADLDEKNYSGVVIADDRPPPHDEDEDEDEPKRSRWQAIKHFFGLFMTPIVISLFAALPIALIRPLKALFTHVDGWSVVRIPNGPDGRPPLAFLLDVRGSSVKCRALQLMQSMTDNELYWRTLHSCRSVDGYRFSRDAR